MKSFVSSSTSCQINLTDETDVDYVKYYESSFERNKWRLLRIPTPWWEVCCWRSRSGHRSSTAGLRIDDSPLLWFLHSRKDPAGVSVVSAICRAPESFVFYLQCGWNIARTDSASSYLSIYYLSLLVSISRSLIVSSRSLSNFYLKLFVHLFFNS